MADAPQFTGSIELAREFDPARGFFAPQDRAKRKPNPRPQHNATHPGKHHTRPRKRLQERQDHFDRHFANDRSYTRPGSLSK